MLPIDDPRVLKLVDLWQEMRSGDRNPSIDDLVDDPVLRISLKEAITAILFVEDALGEGAESPASTPQGVDGRYEIFGEPAAGGMGEVYKARDLSMNGRIVAYKVMRPVRQWSPALVAQFYREAIITDEVRQPGVVPIYAMVTDDSGRPAYVMEFIDGQDLHDVAKILRSRRTEVTGPITGTDILRRFQDACRVVEVAHEKGYVHADLNLKNIMLVEGRKATRVVDWGSAIKVGSEDEQRPSHAVAPEYRDPEVGAGRPPTPASDVFALGICLEKIIEALTGSGEPLLEGRKRTSSLRALKAIVAKAAEEQPGARYANPAALAEDLERLISDQKVLADTEEPLSERSWRWLSGHRTGVFAAFIALVGTVSLALAVIASGRAALRENEAKLAREFALSARVALAMTECNYIVAGSNPPIDRRPADVQTKDRKRLERRIEDAVVILEVLIREFPERARINRIHLATCHLAIGILKLQGQQSSKASILSNTQALLRGDPPADADRIEIEAALDELDMAMRALPSPPPTTNRPPLEGSIMQEGTLALATGRKFTMPSQEDLESGLTTSVQDIQTNVWFARMTGFLFLGRYTEALEANDHLINIDGGPERAFSRNTRRIILMAAETEQARMPWSNPPHVDHAKATRMADYLASQDGVNGDAVFNAACALALASAEEKKETIERRQLADRAMAYLLRIAGQGYFHRPRLFPPSPKDTIQELQSDPALDPIRERPDFRALVDRFQKGQ